MLSLPCSLFFRSPTLLASDLCPSGYGNSRSNDLALALLSSHRRVSYRVSSPSISQQSRLPSHTTTRFGMTASGLMPLLAQQLVEQGSPPAQQRRPLPPAHQQQTAQSLRAPPLSFTSMRSAQQSSKKGSAGTPDKEKREFVFSWTDEMLAQKYQVSPLTISTFCRLYDMLNLSRKS